MQFAFFSKNFVCACAQNEVNKYCMQCGVWLHLFIHSFVRSLVGWFVRFVSFHSFYRYRIQLKKCVCVHFENRIEITELHFA